MATGKCMSPKQLTYALLDVIYHVLLNSSSFMALSCRSNQRRESKQQGYRLAVSHGTCGSLIEIVNERLI